MSFGYSIGDVITVTQLAWRTVQNARKACGEYDELTREVLSLHIVLRRLEQELEKPENPINDVKSGDTYKEELEDVFDGCKRVLNILDQVLTKYNALSERERSGRKLWQQIRFGNGKMTDLAEMRGKLTYYTSAMSLFLNMVSVGTMGRVERQMDNAGGDIKEIKVAVNSITAHLMSKSTRHEGSILTAYADDDRAVWKEFRRELLEDGFSSSVIRKHKGLIKAYIEELGSRGLFDEEDPNDEAEESPYCDVESVDEGATGHDPKTQSESEEPPRPKAKFDLPVDPESSLDFHLKPEAAAHSKAESGHDESPTHDPVSGIDSQPEPKTGLRWIWLSDGWYRQVSPEDPRVSEVGHGSSSTATERGYDNGSDAGDKPRSDFGLAGEDKRSVKEARKVLCDRLKRDTDAFGRATANLRSDYTPPPPGQQHQELTRLSHDAWHLIYDKVAPSCIEWISLSIPPTDSPPPELDKALYDQILLLELALLLWDPLADLLRQQQGLETDIDNLMEVMERLPEVIQSAGMLKDRRSEGKGHRVLFEMTWHRRPRSVVVSNGDKCSLCRDL